MWLNLKDMCPRKDTFEALWFSSLTFLWTSMEKGLPVAHCWVLQSGGHISQDGLRYVQGSAFRLHDCCFANRCSWFGVIYCRVFQGVDWKGGLLASACFRKTCCVEAKRCWCVSIVFVSYLLCHPDHLICLGFGKHIAIAIRVGTICLLLVVIGLLLDCYWTISRVARRTDTAAVPGLDALHFVDIGNP